MCEAREMASLEFTNRAINIRHPDKYWLVNIYQPNDFPRKRLNSLKVINVLGYVTKDYK